MRLPSAVWAEEFRASQIGLRWKYSKTCILKVISWFWLIGKASYLINRKRMRLFIYWPNWFKHYVMHNLSLNLTWNALEAYNEKHLLLATTWGGPNCAISSKGDTVTSALIHKRSVMHVNQIRIIFQRGWPVRNCSHWYLVDCGDMGAISVHCWGCLTRPLYPSVISARALPSDRC